MFKRIVLVAAAALLLTGGLAGFWALAQTAEPEPVQALQESSTYSPAQTITVVGHGSVRIEPDVAQVSIGLETLGESVSEAVAANGDKMTAILDALEAAGIAPEDIQTTNYSVQLDYRPEPMPRTGETGTEEQPLQYRVSNMVNVTIRDLEKVSETLDAVIEAGANNIWGVSFSLEDSAAAQADARAKAVEDAQSRAEALAELGGVTLGPIMSMSEIIGGGAVPMPVMAAERAMGGGGPISPGEVEISYQLQIAYFIEPR